MSRRNSTANWAVAAALLITAFALTACGSSKKSSTSSTAKTSAAASPAGFAVSISESGQQAKFTVPSQVSGGLVTMSLTNHGTNPHSAQLVLIQGSHTPLEALRILGSNGKTKVPNWLHGEGGVGGAAPGQTATATLNLPAGNYLVVDVGSGGGNGPPAFSPFAVAGGTPGAIPSSPVTITAANPSKDHYKWQVAGALHPGTNAVTFVAKGKTALHELSAFRITGHPTKAQLIHFLSTNSNQLPSYVDGSTFTGTAVLDGGLSLEAPLQLTKPGTYVLFCHLHDRDGGKPHFVEGLLTTVTVK